MMIKSEYVNIPNTLSLIRLLGVPFLFVLVNMENIGWFIALFVFLGLTDYFDGLLARRWNQVTGVGSMLDSIADLAYYISIAYFLIVLFPEFLQPNIPYLYFLFSFLTISILISKFKIGKITFLHTHLSRLCGVMVFIAFLASFYMDTTFYIRLVILMYTFAFIEVIAIYLKYGVVVPDTRTIFQLRGNKIIQ